MSSLPFDLFIKMLGKADAKFSSLALLPYINDKPWADLIRNRSKLLNCLTQYYGDLWDTPSEIATFADILQVLPKSAHI